MKPLLVQLYFGYTILPPESIKSFQLSDIKQGYKLFKKYQYIIEEISLGYCYDV